MSAKKSPEEKRVTRRESQRRYRAGPTYAAWQQRYNKQHAEQLRQYFHERYLRNKEQSAQRSKDYAALHQEELRHYHREYRQNNRERLAEKDKRWRETHREVRAMHTQKRRGQKAAAARNDLTREQWQEIKDAFDHCCAYCGRKMQRLTVDHITPYAHKGSNTLWNVVPACASCNSRKHVGPPLQPVQPLLLTTAPARKKRR